MNVNSVIHVLGRSLDLEMQRILIPDTGFDFSFLHSGRDQVQ